jgi:ATP-dependent Clp protease ATP-binding subunit ClpA
LELHNKALCEMIQKNNHDKNRFLKDSAIDLHDSAINLHTMASLQLSPIDNLLHQLQSSSANIANLQLQLLTSPGITS